MQDAGQFILRHAFSLLISIIAAITFLTIDWGFWISTVLFITVYFISSFSIKQFQLHNKLKKFGLTRGEYRHIKSQLSEANKKIRELNRQYGKVRSIRAFKQLFEMNRLAKRIFSIVKGNPRKFYSAEKFFYSHLDSAVELTSKYSLLVSQPIKDADMKIALQQTRDTLESINDVMEDDLRNVLSNDIEELKMELSYAKISIKHEEPLKLKGEMPHDR
ncbi:5-bromo-4-chloroindolyl phosphate hydrolysis family protein [Chungangia koreensis]|uniref:5-bromo-4-chloroindolyl phosphate hydrolysis family protein n=1 Tax=Chungangia koreensis TaxID=752657 RepID=A0ABV8X8I3_9LACT